MTWFVLVSYDITNQRRRRKVASMLENYGRRVQYSVFECLLAERQIAELLKRLGSLIDIRSDSIRLYRLTHNAVTAIQVLGVGQVTALPLVHLY